MTSPAHTHDLSSVLKWLPTGQGIEHTHAGERHRLLSAILLAHVLGIPAFGTVIGHASWVSAIASVILLAIAGLTYVPRLSRRAQSLRITTGLTLSSVDLVHVSGGHIEAHLHFFVVLALVGLYQDWRPLNLACFLVLVSHGVIGEWFPQSMYNHPAAILHPWRWATIHYTFVLAEA